MATVQENVGGKKALTAVALLWFLTVLAASVLGVFELGPAWPPLPTVGAVGAPLLLFAAGYHRSPRFRMLVLSLDPGGVALVHTSRIVGASFLFLHARGELPGVFALPAGWGDIAVALTAPLAVWALRSGAPWGRRAFLAWNVFGLLDFAVALTAGLAYPAGTPSHPPAGPTMLPMRLFPMSLIPGFGVPFLLILHAIALLRVRGEDLRPTAA